MAPICTICKELCSDQDDLKKHYERHRLQCIYCGELLPSLKELENHIHLTCQKSLHTKTEKVGNLSSSKCPQFHLIPFSTFLTLAKIFELGEIKHKEAAWNATHPDRMTKEWVIVRLEHVIKHAFIALRKLHNLEPFDGVDDAGAILFGGSVLAEWNSINKKTE